MTLVDSSVWIKTFQRQDPLDIETVVEWDDIVTWFACDTRSATGFS